MKAPKINKFSNYDGSKKIDPEGGTYLFRCCQHGTIPKSEVVRKHDIAHCPICGERLVKINKN